MQNLFKFQCLLFLLLVILMCPRCSHLYAQNKNSFLINGKVWTYLSQSIDDYFSHNNYWIKSSYIVEKDTLVNNRDCKKLKGISTYNKLIFLYEEDNKVFRCSENGDDELLLNFDLHIGSVVGKNKWGNSYEVVSTGVIINKENKYDYFAINEINRKNGHVISSVPYDTLIVGVGYKTNGIPIDTEILGDIRLFVSCTWPDGQQYVTEYGEKHIEGISIIKNEQFKTNSEKYDLQGKRIHEPKKWGIFIYKGKKYLNK